GTLSITQDTSLGYGFSGLTLKDGATLNFTGFSLYHLVALEGVATIEVDSGVAALPYPISGVGAELVKTGAGTLVLARMPVDTRNTYTGTTIAGGVLELATLPSVGTGAITFAPGVHTTLQIDGTDIPTNTINGFTFGDIIDLAGIAYDSSVQPN